MKAKKWMACFLACIALVVAAVSAGIFSAFAQSEDGSAVPVVAEDFSGTPVWENSTLTSVMGEDMVYMIETYGLGQKGNSQPAIENTAGSEDGFAAKYETFPNGYQYYNGVRFDEAIDASRVESLTFRVYIDMNTDDFNYSGMGGFVFYGLGQTGSSSEGYCIPLGTAQRQWVDLTLDQDAAQTLSGADGKIAGYQVGVMLFDGVYIDKFGSVSVDSVSYVLSDEEVPPVDIDEPGVAEDFSGTPSWESSTLTSVMGQDMAYMSSTYGLAQKGNSQPVIENTAGSEDGFAAKYETFPAGYQYYNGVRFDEPIEANRVESLTFRVYIDMAEDDFGYDDMGGFVFYGLGQTGLSSEGYRIPLGTAQRQWVDLTLNQDEAQALAGADGKIAGYQVGVMLFYEVYNEKFGSVCVDSVSYVLSDEEVPVDPEPDPPAESPVTPEELGLTKLADATAELEEGTLTEAYGYKNFAEYGSPDLVNNYGFRVVSDAGASTGRALRMGFHTWAVNASANYISFSQPVDIEEVSAITVRIYAHLSPRPVYYTGEGGVRIYGAGQLGTAETGYMIPAEVEQDEWTNIVIAGEDLEKISVDGMVSGIQIGAALLIDPLVHNFYDDVDNAYILIDYVAVTQEQTITFQENADTSTEQTVYAGMTAEGLFYVPEAPEGEMFVGWQDEEENAFDFSAQLSGDVILTAVYKQADDPAGYYGLYVNESGVSISVYEDGSADLSEVCPVYDSYAFSENILYVYRPTEILEFDLSADYVKTDHVIVTWQFNDLEEKAMYAKGSVIEPIDMTPTGYRLIAWMLDGSVYDFEQAVQQDIVLVADWAYETVEDPSVYYGTYYDSASGKTIVLGDKFVQDGQEQDYQILASFELLLDNDKRGTLTALSLTFEGVTYIRLTAYTVVFEYGNGQENGRVVVDGGDYKVARPEDPSREGYTFTGWYLGDELYDFESIVCDGITLVAGWERDAAPPADGGNSGGCNGGISVAFLLPAAAGIAVAIRMLKAKKED